MPVPKAPPPGGRGRGRKKVDAEAAVSGPAPGVAVPTGVRHAPINDLLPFLGFVEEHPIGSTVEATTESYSSHGAYVTMDGVRGYVPLRYLGDPAPRSARDVLAMGERATFVVVSFNPPRRGIDLAKPEFAPPSAAGAPVVDVATLVPEPGPVKKAAAKRSRKAALPVEAPETPAVAPAPAKKAAKRTRKAAVTPVDAPESVPVKKAAAKRTRKAAAPEPAADAAPVKKAAAKRTRKAAAPVDAPEPAPVKKAAAKRTRKAAATAAEAS
jgi:hypothetical protein